VGYLSQDIFTGFQHANNSMSQKFADAHRVATRSPARIRLHPAEDNGNGIYVHDWNGLWVQNYNDADFKKRGAILYKPGAEKAYTIRAGFWDQYRYSYGPTAYGAPLNNEGQWIDTNGSSGLPPGTNMTAQMFEKAVFVYHPSLNPVVKVIPVPSGEVAIDEYGTVRMAGGSSGKITVTATPFYNHVDISIQDTTGMNYDKYVLYRNGLPSGEFTGTAITDNGVQAQNEYTYRVAGWDNAYGPLHSSEEITTTTPPNPNTFDVIVSARSESIVDVQIINNRYPGPVYVIKRNGVEIANLYNSYEFSDFPLTSGTTYSYQVEAKTMSGLSEGLTPVRYVTTPVPPVPPPVPPTPPPPQNPAVPLRIVDGIHVHQSPPYLIHSWVSIDFTLENVGTTTLSMERFSAKAAVYVPGWGTFTRNFNTTTYSSPNFLLLAPGERYRYEGTNQNDPFPDLPGTVMFVPYIKFGGIAGEKNVTDVANGTEGLSTIQTQPSIQLSDLVLSSWSLSPQYPAPGEQVNLTIEVKNQGNLNVGGFYVRLVGENVNITRTYDQLNAGAKVSKIFSLGALSLGGHGYDYVIDSQNAHYESDEMNNEGTVLFGVYAQCEDGTVYGSCSLTKPYSCSNGNLVQSCVTCGCPADKICISDGTCRVPPPPTKLRNPPKVTQG
jgi:hypothetical protein